ncbi:hypothetical protein [Bacillus sp. JCM 19034]|uniref:hypothetical protein n=1 Tax=Bacillus sp. JCM 19034 TaxID=1481928 RepID=UPI000783658F|nr:hypothetical protein [Bacillus sp. JCM 19034]
MDSVAAYYVPNSKENNINVSFYNEDGEYDDFEEVKIKKIIGDKIAIRYKHVPEEIYKLHSNAWDLRQIGTLEINENNYQYLLKNGEIRLQDETNDTIHSVEDTNINISLFWKIYMVLLLILFGTFFYQATFMEEHTELSFRLMFWLLIFAGPLLVIGIHQLLVKKVLKRFMNHWFPAILIHATIITLLGSYLYIEYKKLITDYQLLSNGEAITIEGIVTDIPLKDTLDGEQEQVKNRIVIEGIEYSFTKAPIMEIGKSYRITYLPNTLEIIEFQILKE